MTPTFLVAIIWPVSCSTCFLRQLWAKSSGIMWFRSIKSHFQMPNTQVLNKEEKRKVVLLWGKYEDIAKVHREFALC